MKKGENNNTSTNIKLTRRTSSEQPRLSTLNTSTSSSTSSGRTSSGGGQATTASATGGASSLRGSSKDDSNVPTIKIKTKTIERGVAWRNIPNIVEKHSLADEKEELNHLNSRLELLLNLLKQKKQENDLLESEIKKYRKELSKSTSDKLNSSQLGADLDGARQQLNSLSNESSISKIKLQRSLYELNRIKEKLNEEVNLQGNNKTKLQKLENEFAETTREVQLLNESVHLKEKSVHEMAEKIQNLRNEYKKLADELDSALESRVNLESVIQGLTEQRDFETEIFVLMRDELKKLFLTDNDGKKIFDPQTFYETELRTIKDKIRDDFLKMNEYNMDTIREEYETRITTYSEEYMADLARQRAEATNPEEDKAINEEFTRNKNEIRDLKTEEGRLKVLLDELLVKLRDTQSQYEHDRNAKDMEIAYLEEQIRNIKNDSWSILNLSKNLDAEVAIYARLLNERFQEYTGPSSTDDWFERYKEALASRWPKPSDTNIHSTVTVTEVKPVDTSLNRITIIDQELKELRRHQEEVERRRRERLEREEADRKRREEEEKERERERIRKQKELEQIELQIRLEREEKERRRKQLEDEERERQKRKEQYEKEEREFRFKLEREQQERIAQLKREEEDRERQRQARLKEEEAERERIRLQRDKEANELRLKLELEHQERMRKLKEEEERERQKRKLEEEKELERQRQEKLKREEEERVKKRQLAEYELQLRLHFQQEEERKRKEAELKRPKEIEEREASIIFDKEVIDTSHQVVNIPARVTIQNPPIHGTTVVTVVAKPVGEVLTYEERVQRELKEIEKIRQEEEKRKAIELQKNTHGAIIIPENRRQLDTTSQTHTITERYVTDGSTTKFTGEYGVIKTGPSKPAEVITSYVPGKESQKEYEIRIAKEQQDTNLRQLQIDEQQRVKQIEIQNNLALQKQQQEEYEKRVLIEMEKIIREQNILKQQEEDKKRMLQLQESERLKQIEIQKQRQQREEYERRVQIEMKRLEKEQEDQRRLQEIERHRQTEINIHQQQQQLSKEEYERRLRIERENIERILREQQDELKRKKQIEDQERLKQIEIYNRNIQIQQENERRLIKERELHEKMLREQEELRIRQMQEEYNKRVKINEGTSIEILKEKRSNLVENVVDHCVSSSSGRKHVLILENEADLNRELNQEKLSKYALKHKANRYVSGAIGILETSVNGEYIILENLSSTKSVNLNGWYLHRYVPDQGINVVYRFPHDVWLRNGNKLKIWSKTGAMKLAQAAYRPEDSDLVAENVDNWGVYSKYSVTKLINPEGIDKAVLTQSLLRLSASSSNLAVLKPLKRETVEYQNTKTTSTTTTTSSVVNQLTFQPSNYVTGI